MQADGQPLGAPVGVQRAHVRGDLRLARDQLRVVADPAVALVDLDEVRLLRGRAERDVARAVVVQRLRVGLPDVDARGHQLRHRRLEVVVADHAAGDPGRAGGHAGLVHDEHLLALRWPGATRSRGRGRRRRRPAREPTREASSSVAFHAMPLPKSKSIQIRSTAARLAAGFPAEGAIKGDEPRGGQRQRGHRPAGGAHVRRQASRTSLRVRAHRAGARDARGGAQRGRAGASGSRRSRAGSSARASSTSSSSRSRSPAASWARASSSSFFPQVAEKGYQLVYGATANLFTDRYGNYIGFGPEESELAAIADLDTFEVLPWDPRVARVYCDCYDTETGELLDADPRQNLKRIAHDFEQELGLQFLIGIEPEMMWLSKPRAGRGAGGRHASPTATTSTSSRSSVRCSWTWSSTGRRWGST